MLAIGRVWHHTAAGAKPSPSWSQIIAVLLPAAAYVAATVDAGRPPPGTAQVGAAGFGGELLADDHSFAVAPTVGVPPTVDAAPLVTATVPTRPAPAPAPAPAPTVPGRTATTAPPGMALFPTPPGFPPLPMPTFPRTPSASAWSKTADGITVRMHIEPATPVAGRPVTSVVDEVTAPVSCCVIHLVPDGTTIPLPGANGENPETGICGSPPVTRSGLSHTHTYSEPGVYAVLLMVLTGSCRMPTVGGPAVPPTNGSSISRRASRSGLRARPERVRSRRSALSRRRLLSCQQSHQPLLLHAAGDLRRPRVLVLLQADGLKVPLDDLVVQGRLALRAGALAASRTLTATRVRENGRPCAPSPPTASPTSSSSPEVPRIPSSVRTPSSSAPRPWASTRSTGSRFGTG